MLYNHFLGRLCRRRIGVFYNKLLLILRLEGKNFNFIFNFAVLFEGRIIKLV